MSQGLEENSKIERKMTFDCQPMLLPFPFSYANLYLKDLFFSPLSVRMLPVELPDMNFRTSGLFEFHAWIQDAFQLPELF